MKILTVIGARPQFVKAAAVSRVLRQDHDEVLVHTGQHYDYEMSKIFFEGLDIPEPDHALEVGSASHAEQTARMLCDLERVMIDEQPERVIVYGDTNSTLAGAMAAAKLCVPIAHVEAGLRSFNRSMPEEINRICADRVSDLLYCPTPASVANLAAEGISEGVHLVGDVMFDVATEAAARVDEVTTVLKDLELTPGDYYLATLHRAGNTDDPEKLRAILQAFASLDAPLVLPLHPRTKKCLEVAGLGTMLSAVDNILQTQPLGYLDFVALQKNARKILTDSGGVQKEAAFFKVPCVTLRDETEWTETVDSGWNILAGADTDRIMAAATRAFEPPQVTIEGSDLWDGKASQRLVATLSNEETP